MKGNVIVGILILIALCIVGCTSNLKMVTLQVPTEARIKLTDTNRIAVIDFESTETRFQPGSKAAKQLREELKEKLGLIVIDAESTETAIETLQSDPVSKSSLEYYQKLGKLLRVDAIMGGKITFASRDLSGYEREEYVDPRNGNRYYRDIWVDKVGLSIDLEAHLMRTSNGEFILKEKFSDETVLPKESSSTTLYGFFDLIENQIGKLVAQMTPQERTETRYLFTD